MRARWRVAALAPAALVTTAAVVTLVLQQGHWSADLARLAVVVAPLSAALCHLFARPIVGRVSESLTTT